MEKISLPLAVLIAAILPVFAQGEGSAVEITATYRACAKAVDARLAKAGSPTNALARFIDYKKNGARSIFRDNPLFWARDIDFSCEAIAKTDCGPSNGWNMFGATAISPRHVLYSKHCAPTNGTELTFRGKDGQLAARRIVRRRDIGCDLFVGVLDSDLPPAIRPAVLPSGELLGKLGALRRLPVVTLNQREEAVVADIDRFIQVEPPAIEALAQKPTDPKRAAFYKDVVAGDSSNPRFILLGNQALLISLMWHGNGGAGTFLPLIAPKIRKAMNLLAPGYELRERKPSANP